MTQRSSARSIGTNYHPRPLPFDDEFHIAGCECHHCTPAAEVDDRLTFAMLGNLALLGAIVGTAIAFAIDPAGAAQALLDVFRR